MVFLSLRKSILFFLFISTFFFIFLKFESKAFSYYTCNSPTYTCKDNNTKSSCIESNIRAACGWEWGTRYNLGTCQNASGQIEPNSSACIVSSEACCEPGQNGCPCTG